ncbi:MAG: hypothetical protein NZ822_00425 [Patescibacteria group bacterium]|nr:hypothetical protein [Patescibacteria group bacterium]
MKRIVIGLILVSLLLIGGNFIFAQFMTVPVSDSQLKAVNSVLDAIQTTLTEHLKNIDLNIYNLLKVQYEDFFKRNYQDKLLQVWEIQNQIEDIQTLISDLSDPAKQQTKLETLIENAEYAAAYETLSTLSNQIDCLPNDYRSLIEDYASSSFANYDLSKYALSQLSLIPDCENIFPNFNLGMSRQNQDRKQNRGFLANFTLNFLKPFSLSNFLLANNPTTPLTPATFTISSDYGNFVKKTTADGLMENIDAIFRTNIDLRMRNLPDPRDVLVSETQVFSDSGKPITLRYRPIIRFSEVFDQYQTLGTHNLQVFTERDRKLVFSTTSFSTTTSSTGTPSIPDICKRLVSEGDQGKNVDPRIACAQAFANFSTDLNKEIIARLDHYKSLTKILEDSLRENRDKIEQLKATTSPECEELNKRLEELKNKADNDLVHLATVTINVDQVIAALTNNQIQINNTIQRISSTRAFVNERYANIIRNVNRLLDIFKLKGIKSGPLFGGLPLDFLGSIMQDLEGHNFLLVLGQADDILASVNAILQDADAIAGALGISTNLFRDLRDSLNRGIRPVSESVLTKNYFEWYGIRLEINNLEREINRGCRSQRITKNDQPKVYAVRNNTKRLVLLKSLGFKKHVD